MPKYMFFPDSSFHFELLRQLSAAADHGGDIVEVLELIPSIKCGDFDSFSKAFEGLARRVEAQADNSNASTSSGKVSVRDAMFRAATYYRAADFYLHGNPEDPRISEVWERQRVCFDRAIALLDAPGKRFQVPTKDGYHAEGIFFPTTKGQGSRPTMLLGNGFDGSQEEMMHTIGFSALERGFNVVTYEGPGQPTVRREQAKPFIADWEKVVTPVVDYLFEHAAEMNVDTGKIGLWGHSLGGYLGLRACAFEKRIKAYIACGGVWTLGDAIPPDFRSLVEDGKYDEALALIQNPETPAVVRWSIGHGLWVMLDKTTDSQGRLRFADLVAKMKEFSIADVVDQVECKVFVGDAEEDIFFRGQAEKVANALGPEKATYYMFKSENGAGAHCQVGANKLLVQVTTDWFEKAVGA